MKKISVSEFKAKCLRLIEDVHNRKEPLVITKKGIPIAEVRPYEAGDKVSLKETVVFLGDIVSPVAEDEWEALR